MKKILFLLVLINCFSCNVSNSNSAANKININGLKEPVEIIRDQWGINHIYANNQHDLFFTQGYAAAKDRLFQFEVWRRQATGTVAEILGERELKRDIGTRLFKFRGDMTTEMNYYHDEGVEIITAYTEGVNAYIKEILKTPENLPIEFKLLGILPQHWTPEVVISRHQGLLGNIKTELSVGRMVAKLGVEKTKDITWFHPKDPNLNLDPAIDKDLLFEDLLELYNAYRQKVSFKAGDIVEEYRTPEAQETLLSYNTQVEDSLSIGSNNWVTSGALMADGNTYMANDPHRTIAVPSLRYMAHLVAPGWNVIGGGEPEIPGISIGHNDYGAWGLTVFRTDGEDMYVYDLNPDDLNQYKYLGEWVDMTSISETIKVKGKDNVTVELKYTQHGPVTFVDEKRHKAVAIRCAWMEPGGSPYLASLRMDQAKNWQEFREACNYSHIPGENMVWADKEGNIGWQAVGIAPIRRNHSGLVPVPGDGRYEWEAYLPIVQKPNSLNPSNGFIATSNQNVTNEDYENWDAIGYSWSDPYRGDRVEEKLSAGNKMTMDDMKDLQMDYLSIPARILVPMLENLPFDGASMEALKKLKGWDHKLEAISVEAAIYVAFENALSQLAKDRFIPLEAKDYLSSIQMKKIVDWMIQPDERFGADPDQGRDQFLVEAFDNGIQSLQDKLGSDMSHWQYGQEKFKHSYMTHALGNAVSQSMKSHLDVGPFARGGNAYTPASTGSHLRQSSGGSFRMIVNTGDWDAAIGTNSPGQSGDPASPFYRNLFKSWAKDEYFPVYFSRDKIEKASEGILKLFPEN